MPRNSWPPLWVKKKKNNEKTKLNKLLFFFAFAEVSVWVYFGALPSLGLERVDLLSKAVWVVDPPPKSTAHFWDNKSHFSIEMLFLGGRYVVDTPSVSVAHSWIILVS